GLSGKMRIHSLPPRLMKRVIATREASICRSVIQAFSIAFSPYSPNDNSPPRQALPLRRPRICFLYFTFFGINIVLFSFPRYFEVLNSHRASFALLLNLGCLLRNVLALINPALHADDAVRGIGFRSTEIDVRAKGLQRQTPLQVPLFARDFRAVQPASNTNL